MSSEQHTKNLLDVITRLSKLIQDENEILAKPATNQDLEHLVQEKKALLAAYEYQVQNLGNTSLLENNDPSFHERVKTIIDHFQSVTQENSIRLLAKIEATKRVFSIIQEAVQEHENPTKTYGNSGRVQKSGRQAYVPALSVGVNNEI